MEAKRLESLKQIAAGIAAQFGDKCEVVIHDVASSHPEHTIVHIENGHVSGRKIGDGASRVVMEQLEHQNEQPQDHLCYLTRTPGGKILKSSSLYIRNSRGAVTAIFSINYDITGLMTIERSIKALICTEDPSDNRQQPEQIVHNVNDLLDNLIEQSVALIGKPAALMNKEEKVTAIQFLNDAGAFLITKSGDKVSKYFGISKFTLYSYIDVNSRKSS